MSCCGHRRAAIAAASARVRMQPQPPPATAAPPPASAPQSHRLRYLGTAALSLRGPKSGAVYRFAAHGDEAPVAVADLRALLATRLFEPA